MRAYILGGLVAAVLLLAAGTAMAHHSFAAEFDANKPITLTGIVTKVEWTNPHVWFYVNVKDEKTGEVTNWGAEMGPPHGLQRRGWRRDTLKIGEEVTVDRLAGQERQQAHERAAGHDDQRPAAVRARRSTRRRARATQPAPISLTRPSRATRARGLRLCMQSQGVDSRCASAMPCLRAAALFAVAAARGIGARQQPAAPAAGSPPRSRAARARACQVGVRAAAQGGAQGRQGGGGARPRPRRGSSRPGAANAGGPRAASAAATPKEPVLWTAQLGISDPPTPRDQSAVPAVGEGAVRRSAEARARAAHALQGLGHDASVPHAVRRRVRRAAELQRIYIFDIGGPHTFRTIYMDGRSHPKNLTPSYYGHSIGWWEGDTLVVDTDRLQRELLAGSPRLAAHRAAAPVERFTRTDAQNMRYELTIDDPGAYTKPWTAARSTSAPRPAPSCSSTSASRRTTRTS